MNSEVKLADAAAATAPNPAVLIKLRRVGMAKNCTSRTQHSAIGTQHSARTTASCCFNRHPSQQGCKEQLVNGSWQVTRQNTEDRSRKENQKRKTKNLGPQRTQRGAEAKPFRHRFTRMNTDFLAKPGYGEARRQESAGKPKSGNQRPTLAKDALGWGTLKFRYARTQPDSAAGSLLQHRKRLLVLKGLAKRHSASARG
jgi:hypothetical protein